MCRNSLLIDSNSNDEMNTKVLNSNTKLIAVMLTVALCATIGASLAYAQTAGTTSGTGPTTPPQIQGSVNLQQMLLSSVQTKFTDAANIAAGSVTNGQVMAGSLTVIQGSVVYNFKVIDGTKMYSVIVDAGNGKVLNTSQGHPIQLGGLMGMEHHGMMGKFHMGGHGWNQHAPSGTTTPSSDNTNPSTGT